jgi:hypothetical protein
VLFFKSGGKDKTSSSKTKDEIKFLKKNLFSVSKNAVKTGLPAIWFPKNIFFGAFVNP